MSDEVMRVENLTKRFGELVAVDSVDLEIRNNEFFALLGPSGCGKTTLLRMMAGFEEPDAGIIYLGDADITNVKPWKRPLNMMFQSYALFPHMSVFNNVAYGLKQERVEKKERDARVNEALEMVGLGAMANRRPNTLSGGQRQRVALARAIVKRPRVLLLDEPLAALDRKLRVEMRSELKRLKNEVGIAFIFVTHDQEEALSMADRAAIMNAGQVQQVGTPEELYEAPHTLFVADFIGDSNVLKGTLKAEVDCMVVENAAARWVISDEAHQRSGLTTGQSVAVIVRPEHVLLTADDSGIETPNRQRGVITETAYMGASRYYTVRMDDGGEIYGLVQSGGDVLTVNSPVMVSWKIEHGVLVADE